MALSTDLKRIHLRSATGADSDFLLELRNDPTARAHFHNPNPVAPDEHTQWMLSVLADQNRYLYIILNGKQESIGQVRFDVEGDLAEVSITLKATCRGKGYGTESIRSSSEHFLTESTTVKKIKACVRGGNPVSVQAFKKAGYSIDTESPELVVLVFSSTTRG